MKKSLGIAICLVLLTALLMPASVLAADLTSYTSAFVLQNLSQTDAANFTITFYNRSNGSVAATTPSASIPAGSSSSFFTLSAVSAGFDGSAVVSSDQPVAAVSILFGNTNEHIAEFDALSSGATSVYIPLTQKFNYGANTFINVQNTGSSDANVKIDYAGTFTGAPCEETAIIKSGAAARFDQSLNACLPNGFRAATITSDQPVVAVVVQVDYAYSTSVTAGLLASGGFTSGSAYPIMPLLSSGWYGSVGAIQIQNISSGLSAAQTSVTVTYTPTGGTVYPGAQCTETKTINPGASKVFGLVTNNLLAANCRTVKSGQNGFVGSAKVTVNTAGVPLVAIVTQTNSTNGEKAAYNGFDPASATNAIAFPIIADQYNNLSSGFSIVNMGSNSDLITCTYTDSAVTQSKTVAAGGTWTPVQQGKIAASYVGSANCSSAEPMIGIANLENKSTNTGPLDSYAMYEGINH